MISHNTAPTSNTERLFFERYPFSVTIQYEHTHLATYEPKPIIPLMGDLYIAEMLGGTIAVFLDTKEQTEVLVDFLGSKVLHISSPINENALRLLYLHKADPVIRIRRLFMNEFEWKFKFSHDIDATMLHSIMAWQRQQTEDSTYLFDELQSMYFLNDDLALAFKLQFGDYIYSTSKAIVP